MAGVIRAVITVPKNDFPGITARFDTAVAGAMNDTLRDLMQVQTSITPRDTGHLQEDIAPHFAGSADDVAYLDWEATYAGYVNDGTRYMEPRHYMERSEAAVRGRVEGYFVARWGA